MSTFEEAIRKDYPYVLELPGITAFEEIADAAGDGNSIGFMRLGFAAVYVNQAGIDAMRSFGVEWVRVAAGTAVSKRREDCTVALEFADPENAAEFRESVVVFGLAGCARAGATQNDLCGLDGYDIYEDVRVAS